MPNNQQYSGYQGQDPRFAAYNRSSGQGSAGGQMQNQGQMGGPGPSKMQNQSSLVPGSNPMANQMNQGQIGTQGAMTGQASQIPGQSQTTNPMQGQSSMPGQIPGQSQIGGGPNSSQMDSQMPQGHGQMGNQMPQAQMGNQINQGQGPICNQPNFPFNQNQF